MLIFHSYVKLPEGKVTKHRHCTAFLLALPGRARASAAAQLHLAAATAADG